MNRFRTHWLALLGATLLLGLSVSSAFAAHPENAHENRGQQVAAFVHQLVFGADDETSDEEQSQDEEEQQDEEENQEEQQDEEEEAANSHGKCVSEVARSGEVEGVDGTHGSMVSEAARVTCWGTDGEEPVADDSDTGDEEESNDEFTVSSGPGKSSEPHGKGHSVDRVSFAQGNGNGHARGPKH